MFLKIKFYVHKKREVFRMSHHIYLTGTHEWYYGI